MATKTRDYTQYLLFSPILYYILSIGTYIVQHELRTACHLRPLLLVNTQHTALLKKLKKLEAKLPILEPNWKIPNQTFLCSAGGLGGGASPSRLVSRGGVTPLCIWFLKKKSSSKTRFKEYPGKSQLVSKSLIKQKICRHDWLIFR